MDERNSALMRASIISVAGNFVLAASKIIVGLIAGSYAVFGDGIDSSTDVIISLISIIATTIISKPSDKEHPYGHSRAETIATTLLAFFIFFAGAQLFLSTAEALLEGIKHEVPQIIAIYVTVASIAGKLILAWSQYSFGKKTGSSLIIANAKNMRNDVITSAAVLVGLFFTFVLNLPILDSIMALAVSLLIMKTSVGIFVKVNVELMDGNPDKLLYSALFEAVKSVSGARNPHRTRIRQMANMYDIDLDIEVDGSLTVDASHDIAMAVEEAIKTRIDNVYDVMVHVEPAGNLETDEQYGLSESAIGEGTDDQDGRGT
jgi:cation diffusion facilitator family transporter